MPQPDSPTSPRHSPRAELFRNPIHPYTRALLAAVPEPNPNYRLDFARLMADKASKPHLWPAPFTIDQGKRPLLVDAGNDHFVRAESSAAIPEYAS